MKKLINISNHPSTTWTKEQLEHLTELFGPVEDIPFPNIHPSMTSDEVWDMANEMYYRIAHLGYQVTAHVMGEMVFTHALVNLLTKVGILCIASVTERVASIDPETGVKTSVFKFQGYRAYNKGNL